MINYLEKKINKHKAIYDDLLKDKSNVNKLNDISLSILNSLQKKGKIILAGNGGSFSDSMHISAEFTGRFKKDRFPYPSIVLGANSAYSTASSNDFGFENIFLREFAALVDHSDFLICLTTSAKSYNIFNLVKEASQKKIGYVVITGKNNGLFNEKHKLFNINSLETDIIQEITMMILHSAVDFIENKLNEKI